MLGLVPGQNWLQRNGNNVHLVITGGEPLLGWQRAYKELLSHERMEDLRNLTFETNGTQSLQSDFIEYMQEWNQSRFPHGNGGEITFSVSPKISASGESWSDAIRPDVVASYENLGTVYLKFVVETDEHFAEVDRAVQEYRAAGFTGVVYVMPQGGTKEQYEGNLTKVADMAMARGYYLSPRLHCSIWGNGWAK